MAISASLLTANYNDQPASSYNTASVSPAASALILLMVKFWFGSNPPAAISSVAGGGISNWVSIDNITYSTIGTPETRIALYRGMSASPGSGVITITPASQPTEMQWGVVQFTGVDTSGADGAGAIVQSNHNSVDAATSLTVTLSALADAVNNAVFACWGSSESGALTPGGAYNELYESSNTQDGETSEGMWLLPGTTTPQITCTSRNIGGIAVEIKAAASGPVGPPSILASILREAVN